MSFNFTAAGTSDQVRSQLRHQLDKAKSWPNNDTTQAEAVVALIEHHLDNAAYASGLFIEANGHHDPAQANLTLNIRPLWLPVETEATPEPTESAN